MRLIAALSLLALAAGCASTSSNVSARDYRRPELDRLRLERVDVVVVVSGPPRVATERLDVQGFSPVTLETPLVSGAHELRTEEALVRRLRQGLTALGLEARFLGQAPPPEPLTTVATSSTSSAARPAAALTTPPPPVQALPESLGALLTSSDADAVLVIRAVPVDTFSVDVGAGTHVEETPLGRQTVRDFRPEKREGRLMIGQAFLFDRQSKVRLWSRQAPDFPDEGRLTPDHPFLRYGFVASSTVTVPPSEGTRAEASAAAFAAAMLEGFPKASAGAPEARAALDALDSTQESERDAFFDSGHFAFDVAFGYGAETAQLELSLNGAALGPLGVGAVAPSGLLRAVPRLSYVLSSGLTLSGAAAIGSAPSAFGRTYFLDNPAPTLADPGDRAIQTKVTGTSLFGPELTAGVLIHVSDALLVLPRAGAFADFWTVHATPTAALPNLSRVRFGVTGGAEAWLRMGETFYVRGGLDLRLGADTHGPFLFGFQLLAGLGILL